MYEYRPPNNLGEFGYIQALIIGGAQHIAYAVGAGKKWHETEKYLKKTKKTQQMSHQSQLALKGEEAEAQEKLLAIKGQTELYRDMRIKKLVITSIIIVVAVVVLGLGTIIAFSVGGDDE